MKSLVLISFVLIAIMLLSGCGNKPQAVAEKFLAAIEKHDFETASQYVTKTSQEYLKSIKESYDMMSAADKEENSSKRFKVMDGFVESETATVNYQVLSDIEAGSVSKELKLEDENGDWKVKLDRYSSF